MPPTDQSRNHVGELNERKNCEKFQNHFEKPPGSKFRCCKTRPSPGDRKSRTVSCGVNAKWNSSTKKQ